MAKMDGLKIWLRNLWINQRNNIDKLESKLNKMDQKQRQWNIVLKGVKFNNNVENKDVEEKTTGRVKSNWNYSKYNKRESSKSEAESKSGKRKY